jgi:ubiquinone/menaquinone biosynthesis C-methylase UbiE
MRLRARPVVYLDRTRKALMIEAFLRAALGRAPAGLRLLDVGCGNGDIAAHFSTANEAVAIDIADRCRPEHARLVRCIAKSERLPFADRSFDIVISHHVIEHVPDHDHHLTEIRRVLRPQGLCYLGTPNLSSPFMRGHVNNPMVLRYRQMAPLFERNGFDVEEWYARWLHQPDRYHCPTRLGRFLPLAMLHALRRWFPSQCFLLRPRDLMRTRSPG